jgi:hypothetical protein
MQQFKKIGNLALKDLKIKEFKSIIYQFNKIDSLFFFFKIFSCWRF